MELMTMGKLNGRCRFRYGHATLQFVSLIGHNLLLPQYWFNYKANYKQRLYYLWAQMLLKIGP